MENSRLLNKQNPDFFFDPLNEEEIQDITSNTANNKTVSPDNIPTLLLQQFEKELSATFINNKFVL